MIVPALGNPLGIARNWLDPAANPLDNLARLQEVADAVLSQARTLGEQLPPATLDWRMKVREPALLSPHSQEASGCRGSIARVFGADSLSLKALLRCSSAPLSPLQMMRLAIPKLNLRLKDVMQRVLIVAGSDDQLLPSAEEAKRLSKAFQRSAVQVVQGGGHALLQEAGVDLLSIVKVSVAQAEAMAEA